MYSNILVPIAFEPGQNRDEAIRIARALSNDSAKVTVLHVMEEVPSYVAQYLPEGQLTKNSEEIEARIRGDLAGNDDVDIVVVNGHAGHTIVEFAARNDVDCIVVASHRPGLQDYFLGSTAARVVRHAPCSVHVVR